MKPPESMKPSDLEALVEPALREVERHYVFPDRAMDIAAAIRERLRAGAYEASIGIDALCDALSQDLYAASGDLHLRLEPAPEGLESEEALRMRAGGYGIERVERLQGNIGLLVLRYLAPASVAGEPMNDALRLLAERDALIIDLRRARGGDPGMIALLCTHLFDAEDGPRHLNDIHHRDGRLRQWWTLPWLPGPRIGSSVPVRLLTSAETFSGAEELVYNLRALGRATVVGERTAGGAHPSRMLRLPGGIRLQLPDARSINPHTGDNWEGRGIEPDLRAPASQALEAALGWLGGRQGR